MKKIEAIIRPEKVTESIKRLRKIGISGFRYPKWLVEGKQKDTKGVYRRRLQSDSPSKS